MKYAILTMSFLILGLVNAKPLSVEYTKKEISCFGKKDGQLDLIIHGGKAPFLIQLNSKPTGAVISELGAGCYDVQVRDAKGEVTSLKVEFVAPKPLTMHYNTKSETLIENLAGSVDMKFSGGSPWNIEGQEMYFTRLDGQANFQDPTLIKSGIHQLAIEDAAGCKLSVKVNLTVNVIYNGVPSNDDVVVEPGYNGFGNVNLTIYKNSPLTLNVPSASQVLLRQ
jgi:hypothetical protein